MAHLAGTGGSVIAGVGTGTTATGIKAWSVDYTIDVIESTDFADAGVRSYILGASGWAGSFDGLKDGAPIALSTATCALQLKESATTGQIWTGNAYITGIHPSVTFDGIVTYSYDFQGTGALTIATA